MADPKGRRTSGPGTGFVVRCLPPLRDGKGLGSVHRPLVDKVGLVPHDDDGDILVILDADNLLAEGR